MRGYELPKQPGYFTRRRRLADTLEWLMGMFASQAQGSTTISCWSTPPRARSRQGAETLLGDKGYAGR